MGEELAVKYIEQLGYKILERNYRFRGEIDIIAQDEERIVFIEVKMRRSESFGLPQEAVDRKKQSQIISTAHNYLAANHLLNSPCRFDVITLCFKKDKKDPIINLIKNAFVPSDLDMEALP